MNNTSKQKFTELIQDNTGIINKVLFLYLDDPEDRDDLNQEILFQAWKSYPRFKGNSKFSTWLYKVSLNTVFTYQRKTRKKPEIVEFEEHHEYDDLHESKTDQQNSLLYLIKKLDEVNRMIISLHLDGYKNEEIAEITGLTKNNAAVKLHRIKEKLISKMKGGNL